MMKRHRNAILEEILQELEPTESRRWLLEMAFDLLDKTPLEVFKKLEELSTQSYERGYNEGRKQQRLDGV
jgi:hypothetical protein